MSNNTKLGVGSLNSNNGNQNTAIGAYASNKNTEGFSNTSLGVNAGFFNETGDYNTSLGSAALCNNLNGSSNTAVGSNALLGTKNLSIGNSNTGVGVQSLEENTGDFNTALGAQSGLDLTGGSYNTYLGAKTNASSQDLNHSTAIGYGAKIDASNQIMMGTASETVQVPGDLNVINGQATFNGPFVGGTTGARGINTNTVIGKRPSTIFDVSANHSNVYIGNNILAKYSGRIQNVAVGNRALQNGGTLVDKTVAIGYEALKNYRADDIDPSNAGTGAPGTSSVAVGAFAGLNCKDCKFCTFLGTDADVDSSAASYNSSTAIGYNAKIDASNQIMMGTASETVKIPGTLFYQTYRQPIIFSCIVSRDSLGTYYLHDGHSYGIDTVVNDSTGELTIHFSQPLNNNRYKPMLSGGFNSLNDGQSGIIFGQNIVEQTNISFNFVMLERDGGLTDLADDSSGSVYVTVYYYP